MRYLTKVAGAVVAALVGWAAVPGTAHAVVCTGTTATPVSGQAVDVSFLLTAGNCVAAGDKIFGEFSTTGAITTTGSASFTFLAPTGNVTLGFLGTVAPGSVGGFNYSVQVDPLALAAGWRIEDLQKDFTLNAANSTGFATATLTGGVTSPGGVPGLTCTRDVNPSNSNCPVTGFFGPFSQISVAQSVATGPNAVVTAFTDTVSQIQQRIPEPGSLALLGAALAGFGVLRRRRTRNTA